MSTKPDPQFFSTKLHIQEAMERITQAIEDEMTITPFALTTNDRRQVGLYLKAFGAYLLKTFNQNPYLVEPTPRLTTEQAKKLYEDVTELSFIRPCFRNTLAMVEEEINTQLNPDDTRLINIGRMLIVLRK